MALSYQRATSDGTLTFIDVSIDYIERAEINVFLNDVLTSSWSWSGSLDKRILFPSALANGVVVTVRRITDASALRHEFSRGAAFIAQALDEDLKQALHIAQEASEGNPSGDFFQDINLHGFRLLNVGTAVDDTDALTLGQYKSDSASAFTAAVRAEAAASTAENAANNVLVRLANPTEGAKLVYTKLDEVGAVSRTQDSVNSDYVSLIDFGADPTGVSLCNSAVDRAKAAGYNAAWLPNGVYRFEGYSAQDFKLVGIRSTGGNVGVNEQVVIEGDGDIFINANNFSLQDLVLRNRSAGSRGKLITPANFDTRLGPFVDVDFRKATHHIYASNPALTLVHMQFENCRFTDASVYSRYYLCNLFSYSEQKCYTQSNQRAMFIGGGVSAFEIGGASVFEFQKEGAIYTAVPGSSTTFVVKLDTVHFENNGTVTPSPDITLAAAIAGGSGAILQVAIENTTFNASTIPAGNVALVGDNVRIVEHNCKAIAYSGITPSMALHRIGSEVVTTGRLVSNGGFSSDGAISKTITATPTVCVPAAPNSRARLVVVRDATSGGATLLLVTDTVISVVSAGISQVTFALSAGNITAQTTGGASSRVLFFTHLTT